MNALRLAPALVFLAACGGQKDWIFFDAREYHLGDADQPEWEEFAGRKPYSRRLDLPFVSEPNEEEHTLFLRQENVKRSWDVQLNSKRIGRLYNQEAPLVFTAVVPPGALREGENLLSVIPRGRGPDDILIRDIGIDPRPVDVALAESTLVVEIYDKISRERLPGRITIVDSKGTLAPVVPAPNQKLAVRPGVVYTGTGRAKFLVPAGRYTLYATRGFEYGVDQRRVIAAPHQNRYVRLTIRREVRTPNLVSCDTHIHTKELSGHGDSGLDERMVTLAGEGVELPIATEHNQHADYGPAAERTGTRRYFTPVIGNEVTTRKGHFNIFPVRAGSRIPDHKLTDWPKLMTSIRQTPDVRVIILNHPCDAHSGFTPFAPENINTVTGKNRRGEDFTFNAVELVNSGALRSDLMETYRDWFALLNYGYRIVGVGSSDSHDVSRSIVGYGRTYIRCPDADPSKVDAVLAARNLVAGRAYVSMGLLTILKVNDQYDAGDLARDLGPNINVTVTVHGPSWTKVDRIDLYANGIKIGEERLAISGGAGLKVRKTWRIPRPKHDFYLVAIASGPGVTAPFAPTPRPYQASSRVWVGRVLGSNNPVWIDADGDGSFTSPRGYASRLVEIHGTNPTKLIPALAGYPETVAVQAAGYCHGGGEDIREETFERLLRVAPDAVRRGFAAFKKTLPAP